MIREEVAKGNESGREAGSTPCRRSRENGVSEGLGTQSATLLRMTRITKIGEGCWLWQWGDHE